MRTVILRRVTDEGTLIFFTDTRSEKAGHLAKDDRMEIHAWWTKGRVQFRLRGRATISSEDEDPVRQELWMDLHEEDLERFFGPAPGSPRGADQERTTVKPSEAEVDEIADTFAIVRLVPEQVDVLYLNPGGHVREHFWRQNEGWSSRSVQP